ncbi:MAG: S8 family peptidase [Candidatus Thorarchaeota archaeon]
MTSKIRKNRVKFGILLLGVVLFSTNLTLGVATQDELDWGVDRINAEVVWGGTEDATDVSPDAYAGQGVKIAILDSGIDYTHPDLDDNYVVGGPDFVNNDTDPLDDSGHGTHVAGIIAAEDNGQGVIGVAPKASIYAVKTHNYWGVADPEKENIVQGIDWAIAHGMDVISMSFVFYTSYYNVKKACERAYNAGIVLIAATGNDGEEATFFPAAYDTVIAVGATDENDDLWYKSNYGVELDVVAPGEYIKSTTPTYDDWFYLDEKGATKNYDSWSGTSMATPHVTGIVALLLSKYPELRGHPDEVKDRLLGSAKDLAQAGTGHGLVQADDCCDPAFVKENSYIYYDRFFVFSKMRFRANNAGTYTIEIEYKINSGSWVTDYTHTDEYAIGDYSHTEVHYMRKTYSHTCYVRWTIKMAGETIDSLTESKYIPASSYPPW